MADDERNDHIRNLIQQLFKEGVSLRAEGKTDEALARGLEAVERSGWVFGWKAPAFRASVNLVAATYMTAGNTLVSSALYEWLLRTAEEAGDDARARAIYRSNRGHCLLKEGFLDEAVAELTESFHRLMEEDPPGAMQTLHSIAESAYHDGDFELAALFHRMVLEARRLFLPPNDPELATSLHNFASALLRLGEVTEAAKLVEEAVPIFRSAYPDEHPYVFHALAQHADLLHRLGEYGKAAPVYRRLLELLHAAGGGQDEGAQGFRARLQQCAARVPPPPLPEARREEPVDAMRGVTKGLDVETAALYKRCVRAFLARDYATSAEAALAVSQRTQRHDMMQLLAISLLRLGLEEIARQVLDWAMEIAAGSPYQVLLAHTAGLVDWEAVARVTSNRLENECEFFGACRLALDGDGASAAELWRRVAARNGRSFEGVLSMAEVVLREARVDAEARPSAGQLQSYEDGVTVLRVKRQVQLLMKQINELAASGDLEAAVEEARTLSEALSKQGPALAEDCASALNLAAHLLYTNGRYEASLPYYEETLRILRANSGSLVLVGAAMNNLGNLYTRLGKHADAIRLQVLALADRRSALGEVDPMVLLCLLDLASSYREAGEATQAAEQYRAALATATAGLAGLEAFVRRLRIGVERALTAGDLEVAAGALRQALSIWETSQDPQAGAEELVEYATVLAECEKRAGAETKLREVLQKLSGDSSAARALAARCLCDLGRMIHADRKEEAAGYLQQALELLGNEQGGTLRTKILLGLAESNRGSQAEAFAQQAIQSARGASLPQLEAAAWHALGVEQEWAGQRNESDASYRRALELRPSDAASDRYHDLWRLAELALNDARPDKAEARVQEMEELVKGPLPVPRAAQCICLKMRGRIAMQRKNMTDALAYLRQALERQMEEVPDAAALRAAILSELGPVYLASGATRQGIAILQEAQDLFSSLHGGHELQMGFVLSQLAQGKYTLGDLAAAGDLIRKAMEILEPLPGVERRVIAGAFRTAGLINLSAGARKTALTHLETARWMFAGTEGEEAVIVAMIDLDLSHLHQAEEQWDKSLALAEGAEKCLDKEGVSTTAACRLQAQAHAALGRKDEALEKAMEALSGATDDFRLRALGLSSKECADGRLSGQNALNLLLTLAVEVSDAAAPRVFAAVQTWQAQVWEILAAHRGAAREPRNEEERGRWRMIDELQSLIGRTLLQKPTEPLSDTERHRVNEWEARIRELEYGLFSGPQSPRLPTETRAVDVQAMAAKLTRGEILLQYVRHDVIALDSVITHPLRTEREARYVALALVADPVNGEAFVRLFSLGDAAELEQGVAAFRGAIIARNESQRELGEFLRQRLLDPVMAALRKPAALRIVAEGALAALPFDALPRGEGFLLEAAPLSYLEAGRERLRFETPPAKQPNPPVVIAAPNFNLRDSDEDAPSDFFPLLAGAEKEGAVIARRLGVRPLLGDAAVESALRAMPSPRILHLATHGFYIPKARYEGPADVYDSVEILEVPGDGQFLVGAKRKEADDSFSQIHGSRLDNPLLRSGLLMAGANTWLAGRKLPIAAEDGVMTALDVAGLDLSGTEIVVLSACETGLGVTDDGAGTLGLRTAFAMAGARSIVVSYWPVADEATTLLMEEFYRHLLVGEPRDEALRLAKLKLLAGSYADPIFWAAFACVGDPRSLDLQFRAGGES